MPASLLVLPPSPSPSPSGLGHRSPPQLIQATPIRTSQNDSEVSLCVGEGSGHCSQTWSQGCLGRRQTSDHSWGIRPATSVHLSPLSHPTDACDVPSNEPLVTVISTPCFAAPSWWSGGSTRQHSVLVSSSTSVHPSSSSFLSVEALQNSFWPSDPSVFPSQETLSQSTTSELTTSSHSEGFSPWSPRLASSGGPLALPR